MYYYNVGIGVEKFWKSNQFTYFSNQKIPLLNLVRVPFGKNKKIGVVISEVDKPEFDTKEIYEVTDISLSENQNKFLWWFNNYYETTHGETMKLFLPSYLTKSKELKLSYSEKTPLPELTDIQNEAYKEILSSRKPTILHGITGSGKTRIYQELINKNIENGQDTLLLLPEISLTTQLINEIKKVAPVIEFHSQLIDSQKSRVWFHISKKHEPTVVIGARSALFLPHNNLGLVIIDEAHDTSYKQNSGIRYNSIHVAGGLANSHFAKLILGSATPPVTETELILKSGGNLVCIHEKAIDFKSAINLEIIDLENRANFKINSMLSDKLIKEITKSLEQKKQSLIFINRRGTAKLLVCENCGWISECLNCDLPLTYHHDVHKMLCHTCGNKYKVQQNCPVCENRTVFKSFGSKAIVEEIKKLFPEANIERYDSDTAINESFYKNYEDIKKGKVDILVGTQQISKGIDLPKLRTIGVLNADLSMHFPDYSSDERTFQLLTQILGRIGRGHTQGFAVIQTKNPKNPLIEYSINENWHDFFKKELKSRLQLKLPPYRHLLKIIYRNRNYEKAFSQASIDKNKILKNIKQLKIDGPIPAFIPKRSNHYYVQIHIYSVKRNDLLKAGSLAAKDSLVDFDPISLL